MTGAEDVLRRLVAQLGDAADFHFARKYVDCIVEEYAGKLATLGAGTCHDKGTFNSWGLFTCSNCSVVFPLDAVKDAPSIGRTLPPKYCPNCGRKVVSE